METAVFQIHSVYDHRTLRTMSRVLRKTMRRNLSLFVRIAAWIWVLVLVLLLAVSFSLSGFEIGFKHQALAFVPLSLMLLLLFLEDDLNAWIAASNILPGTREADTAFEAERYVVTTQSTQTVLQYDKIQALCETGDSFVLLLSKRHVQLFPKAGLPSGDVDRFRDFLSEKTGLPVQHVK